MKIFVLDDDPYRIAIFKDILPPDTDLFIAMDAEEAIRCLGSEKWFDVIFLDHDLGGMVYVDSDDSNTGYQVAKYIADNDITCNALFIHTLNYAGAMNMLSVLPHAVYIPFTSLVVRGFKENGLTQ